MGNEMGISIYFGGKAFAIHAYEGSSKTMKISIMKRRWVDFTFLHKNDFNFYMN